MSFTPEDRVRGGKKGGKQRAKVLSPERRKEIARQAALARWRKRPRKSGDEREVA